LGSGCEPPTHKLVGTRGCQTDHVEICGPPPGTPGPSGNGQHNGGLLHQSAGGNEVGDSVPESPAAPAMGSAKQNTNPDETYTGEVECHSRRPLQGQSDSTDGVDTARGGLQPSEQNLGTSPSRSVCHQADQQAAKVLLPNARRPGNGSGCHDTAMERNASLCIPSHQATATSSEQDPGRERPRGNTHSPLLAGQAMVPSAPEHADRPPSRVTRSARSATATNQSEVALRPTEVTPSRLEIIEQSLAQGGFSARAAARIAAPQRLSTQKVYQSKWNRYSSWCHKRQIDPLQAHPSDLADFFLELSEEGLHPRTIEGYRSAISHTYTTGGRWDVGKHPQLTSLIHNLYKEVKTQRPQIPEWDLNLVLATLSQPPYEPMATASLEHITLKTVFLITLASAARRGEIHAMMVKGIKHTQNWLEVTIPLNPDFLPKTYVPHKGTSVLQDIVIPSLKNIIGPDMPEEKLMCPVRALRFYLDRTSSIRGVRQRLFIAYKKGHKGEIAPATVSSWVKRVIHRAYANPNKVALERTTPHAHMHEVRAVAASWAALSQVPLESIIRSCQWRSDTVFTSHYLTNIAHIKDNMKSLGPVVVVGTVTS